MTPHTKPSLLTKYALHLRLCAATVLLMLLLAVPSKAGVYKVSYAGGTITVVETGYPTLVSPYIFNGAWCSPLSWPDCTWGPIVVNGQTVAQTGLTTCQGDITVTFNWVSNGVGDDPPTSIRVREDCTAAWRASLSDGTSPTGLCYNDLGDPAVPAVPSGPPGGTLYSAENSVGTHYWIKSNPGLSFTYTRSPYAMVTGACSADLLHGGAGMAMVSYTASTSTFLIDLLADTDRSGKVGDPDEPGKDGWGPTRGTIYTVNFNADDKRLAPTPHSGSLDAGTPIPDAIYFNDAGDPEYENKIIGGPSKVSTDTDDIAPLVVRGMKSAIPTGCKLFLKVDSLDQIQAIHLYRQIAAGEISALGGPSETLTEIDITSWVSDNPLIDHIMGVEGLFLKGMNLPNHAGKPFGGIIAFTLELRQGAAVIDSSRVKMKVAPWIALPNSQPSKQVWAAACPIWPYINSAFIAGLSGSGQLHTVPYDYNVVADQKQAGSQWFQDHAEIGYTQRPGARKVYSVFRLPYYRAYNLTQPTWPLTKLLSPTVGVFQVGPIDTLYSGDYGGNIELLPPNFQHPFGNLTVGSTISDPLFAFLVAQEIQNPIKVPTGWLEVGHIDETLAYGLTSQQVIIASPTLAYQTLQANLVKPNSSRDHVMFYKGSRPQYGIATQDSALANSNILFTGIDYTNTNCQWIRMFSGRSKGQVAHIVTPGGLGNGFVQIDWVYNTGSLILNAQGNIGNDTNPSIAWWAKGGRPPQQATWFTLPQAGDEYIMVDDTQYWINNQWTVTTPALLTVQEVLNDGNLKALNDKIVTQLQIIQGDINDLAGGATNITYVSVPEIYVGNTTPKIDGSCFAFTPGLANAQIVNNKYYFAKQFLPGSDAGLDIFEAIPKLSFGAANSVFLDDWDCYHRFEGEVHCGTAVTRNIYSFDWWTLFKKVGQ